MQTAASQIKAMMLKAGFPASQVSIGIGIVGAESHGNANATNHNNNGSTDYGLWQINSVHHSLLAGHDWRDPQQNTDMAYSVWKSSGWNAWTTYRTGAYKQYTNGRYGFLGAHGGASGKTSGGTEPEFNIGMIVDPHSYLRLAYFVIGIAAIGIAIWYLAETHGVVDKVSKGANKIVNSSGTSHSVGGETAG
jgi:hypothetical protein